MNQTAEKDAPWTPCPVHASQQQPCRECRLAASACLACREEGLDLACLPVHADCPIPPASTDPVSRVQAIEAAEDRADQVAFDAWRERRL